MDLDAVFNDPELKNAANERKINRNIPLIGYAVSFPAIENDPGAIYMANEYIQQDDPEIRNDDSESPDDINNTDINDIN
jgi:hypothetical protein